MFLRALDEREGGNACHGTAFQSDVFFGFSIDLDYPWFLIAGLLAWMLAATCYPTEFQGWTASEYWVMGIVTAVLLFAGVLIHELAHSILAQHYGLSVPRITLFLFGGATSRRFPAASRWKN